MISLGTLYDTSTAFSTANAVSSDGSVVVGATYRSSFTDQYDCCAFRWTAEGGMQSVEDWLRANGVAVPTDMTHNATAVNATGNVVVGSLRDRHPFIARVEPPPNGGGSGLLELDGSLATSLNSPTAVSLTALRTGELILDGEHGRVPCPIG